MATGCVSSLDSGAKQRLQATLQEGICNYQEDTLCDAQVTVAPLASADGAGPLGVLQDGGDPQKKPRRKDTPVLSTPPHIPGARLTMGEDQTIFLEDEEKDG